MEVDDDPIVLRPAPQFERENTVIAFEAAHNLTDDPEDIKKAELMPQIKSNLLKEAERHFRRLDQ